MHELKSLFEPVKVGGVELKNRIVMAPIGGHGYCQSLRSVTSMGYYEMLFSLD